MICPRPCADSSTVRTRSISEEEKLMRSKFVASKPRRSWRSKRKRANSANELMPRTSAPRSRKAFACRRSCCHRRVAGIGSAWAGGNRTSCGAVLLALEDGSVRADGRQEKEKAAEPGSDFKECATGCPTMVVVPAGKFTMGSPESEKDRLQDEGPQQR